MNVCKCPVVKRPEAPTKMQATSKRGAAKKQKRDGDDRDESPKVPAKKQARSKKRGEDDRDERGGLKVPVKKQADWDERDKTLRDEASPRPGGGVV